MKDIRIAAAIFQSRLLETDRNLDRMEGLIRAAKAEGAAVVCFPEMNITGYSSGPDIQAAAEPIPGPISRRLCDMAAGEGMVVLAGMAERDGEGRIYVSHLAVEPSGKVSVYRKLHIAPPEKAVYSPGETIPLFDIEGIVFGIQLCYDTHFPELSTLMTQRGADVVFMPHASPRGTPEDKYRSWSRHLPARAFDNSLYIVACNQSGKNANGLRFPGIAMVIDPSGNVVGKDLSDREGLIVADLSAAAVERVRNHPMRFFFPNRRPGLYRREGPRDPS